MKRYAIAIACTAFASSGAAAEPAAPYAPLAFLAGHCWQGELPGGKKDIDTHCFSWVYGDKFVRDVHTVRGAGHADYVGESIYHWNGAAKKLQYLYFENGGGSSSGDVEATASALVFPAADYQDGGKTQTYRSRWTHSDTSSYDVVTEFKQGDAWTTAWTVHMRKLPDKATAAN